MMEFVAHLFDEFFQRIDKLTIRGPTTNKPVCVGSPSSRIAFFERVVFCFIRLVDSAQSTFRILPTRKYCFCNGMEGPFVLGRIEVIDFVICDGGIGTV